MVIKAIRHHDISCGHRVVGHEGKCALLHGHNYRIHFHCEASELDDVGRVIDFSVIKSTMCEWLELNWDHKFLAWNEDPLLHGIGEGAAYHENNAEACRLLDSSIVWLGVNPTAENLAKLLLDIVGPALLKGTGVTLTKVVVEETRKCSVEVTL